MRYLTGIILLFSLMLCGKFSLSQADELVCLVYHRFGDERYPSTNIQTQVFERQLRYFQDQNFNLFTLSDAIRKLKDNSLPKKSAVITIDDGYRSFLTGAMPILEKYNVPATLFINTETVGSGDYLNWQEIRNIKEKGIEIGNHSHAHDHFLNLNDDKRKQYFLEDLKTSSNLFKENLGFKPIVYSYPYGEWDQTMQDVLKANGILCAAAQNSGAISSSSNLFALPRFPMNEIYGKMESFITKVNIHALPILWVEPEQPLLKNNPPVLQIGIEKNKIIEEQINCFVDGEKSCIKSITSRENEIVLKIVTEKPLSDRRTLYTITAPLISGKGWCWYSHLWVKTDVSE